MNVLKAYADAGALGQQSAPGIIARGSRQGAHTQKQGGDFLSLSEAAQNLLEQRGQNALAVMPQDATYDQNGQVMRQLDSLQGDLRHLASQFINDSDSQAMAHKLGAMQSRLYSIRAQV